MSKIEEMALKAYPVKKKLNDKGTGEYDANFSKRKAYILGVLDALGEIENFMKVLDLGNSVEEKFHKLDVLADIHVFIQQLKEK